MRFDGLSRFLSFKIRRAGRIADEALSRSPESKPSANNEDPGRLLNMLRSTIDKILRPKATVSSDLAVIQLSKEYNNLDIINKRHTLNLLATEYGVDRANIQSLAQLYLGLQPVKEGKEISQGDLPGLFRIEQSLRAALTPLSAQLFRRINCQPGGLKFLVDLRADLREMIEDQSGVACYRALDACLKEMLETALNPAGLELHQFTWDDPASILEKIVVFEAVHPISNLHDLKRRLGLGRRCFGYFHPSMPGEPLNFIEVALSKSMHGSIQDVLRNQAPIPEDEATIALFYSISSTQPGLAGINLGKFLIKRVVALLQRDMSNIKTFATLSPIPGFMAWLLPKLAAHAHTILPSDATEGDGGHTNTFKEDLLYPWEAKSLLAACSDREQDCYDAHVLLWNLLTTSPHQEWTRSEQLQIVMEPLLLRLCARYLLKEKKRGKALDAVANFHVQNGAMVERLNWMGDTSEKGLNQSAGIMVNYVYRLDKLDNNIEQYLDKGVILASLAVEGLLHPRTEA